MVRRILQRLVVAVFLAFAFGAVAPRVMDITVPSICDHLEPGGFWWRFWGCEKDSAGGGSGGAG